MLGVIIEGEPHPPITHIGPAARAPNDTSENLVVSIISASAGETFFKNYRPAVRNVGVAEEVAPPVVASSRGVGLAGAGAGALGVAGLREGPEAVDQVLLTAMYSFSVSA